MKAIKTLLLLPLLIASLSCSSGDNREGSLLDSESEEFDLSAEEERLRRMQMIRVIGPNGLEEKEPAWLWDQVAKKCHAKWGGGDPFATGSREEQFTSCSGFTSPYTYCEAFVECQVTAECWNDYLMQVIDAHDEPVVFGEGDEAYEVVAQSAATNAALLESVARVAGLALESAALALSGEDYPVATAASSDSYEEAEMLYDYCPVPLQAQTMSSLLEDIETDDPFTHGDPFSRVEAMRPDLFYSELTAGEFLVASIVENYQVATDAVERSTQLSIAVAHSQVGSTPDAELAAVRSQSGSALSLASAAHKIVGGKPGLEGRVDNPMCSEARLDVPERQALELFRRVGIAPGEVLDGDIDIETLVDGTTALGSLRERLSAFEGINSGVGILGGGVTGLFGLDYGAFARARAYLKQEILTYSRSLHAKLVDHPTGPDVFAGTATKPSAPEVYWMALALTDSEIGGDIRTSVGWEPLPDSAAIPPPLLPEGRPPTLAEVKMFGATWAYYLTNNPTIVATSPSLRAAFDVIVGDQQFEGALSVCGYNFLGLRSTHVVNVFDERVHQERLWIVRGEDALRCALSGNIEGAPCTASADIEGSLRSAMSESYDPLPGFSGFQGVPNLENGGGEILSADGLQREYLLTADVDAPEPGQYRALAGYARHHPEHVSFGEVLCRHVPFGKGIRRRVARILEPNPDYCAEPRISCAETTFDLRLPLENELSDDGDRFESSWRYYLGLAGQAADESDLRAKEYINDELSTEQAESAQQEKALVALEELQDICGTAVDASKLLGILTNGSAVRDLGAGSCDDLTDLPTGVDEQFVDCIAGRRFVNLTKALEGTPELDKLRTCIVPPDDAGEEEWVHLGGKAGEGEDFVLCAWSKDGTVCKDTTTQCPRVFLDSEDGTATQLCNDWFSEKRPEGRDVDKISLDAGAGLGLFDTLSSMPPPPAEGVCDGIREMRTSGFDQQLFDALRESGIFSKERLLDTRERMELVTSDGGYVDIKLDGGQFVSTGNGTTGLTSGWPATKHPTVICPEGRAGLFCSTIKNTKSFESVGEFSRRLVVAYVAAQAMSGGSTTSDRESPPLSERVTLPVMIHEAFRPLNSQRTSTRVKRLRDRDGPNGQTEIPENGGATFPILKGPDGYSVHPEWSDSTLNRSVFGFLGDSVQMEKVVDGEAYRASFLRLPLRGLNVPTLGYQAFFGGLALHELEQGYLARLLKTGARSAYPTPLFLTGVGVSQFSEVGSGGTYEQCLAAAVDDQSALQCNSTAVQRFNARARWAAENGLEYELDRLSFAREPLPPHVAPYLPGELLTLFPSMSSEAALDGLELLCEVEAGSSFCSSDPPPINGPGDLGAMGNYMECRGSEILHGAATQLMPSFPSDVIDSSGQEQVGSGTLESLYSDLRMAMDDVALAKIAIGRSVRTVGTAMSNLDEEIIRLELREEVSNLTYQSKFAQNVTACLASGGGSLDPVGSVTAGVRQAATCANSLIQTRLASRILDAELGLKESDVRTAITNFNDQMDSAATTLEEQEIALGGAVELVRQALGAIASEKAKAARALNKALWYLSDDASAVDGQRKNRDLSRERYLRAHQNAQRYAFLAKRAIEQRIGVRLSEMNENLTLVDAPQSWEASVCETSAVDYATLKDADGEEEVKSFADRFIGDYVTKLQNVVESYRLEHDFSEGQDTSVVSLRDDVLHSRASCLVDGPNLLHWASALDRAALQPLEPGDWVIDGCVENSDGEIADCVSVTRAVDSGGEVRRPFNQSAARYHEVVGQQLDFGGGEGATCDDCSWTTDVSVGQTLELQPGLYRFSWYTPQGEGEQATTILKVDGVNRAKEEGTPLVGDPYTWDRYHFTFEVTESSPVYVGFQVPESTPSTFVVAAPQLEKLDSLGEFPGMFANTTETRMLELAVCPDFSGSEFRKNWTRGCELLCPDGFSSNCSEAAAKECYWETSFHITQPEIESGKILASAGFARGNFNYRIGQVGVNFVGTGLRSCEDSASPESCYGSGNLTYSLYHTGPFKVRNHFGGDYQAFLYTGSIEHARGLASERYISNPVSSADQGMLAQYERSEFFGRPLHGTFTLRVWDEPGVQFQRLQDVQLVLGYGYWTRNE